MSGSPWLEPWCPIESPQQAELLAERLRLEVAVGHVLYNVDVEPIGKRFDTDDVLFRLLDGTARVAEVHLTWTRHPPERPPWPSTVLFPSFAEWLEVGMASDHEEWQ